MDFRVKVSEFLEFNGKQDSWLNLWASFESIDEVAGIEETLNEVLENEDLHKDKLKGDEYYTEQNTKLCKLLKKYTAKGTDSGRVKNMRIQNMVLWTTHI